MARRVAKDIHYGKIDIHSFKEAITGFNCDIGLLASDYLMNMHFTGMELGLVPLKVVLLDGMWATQLFRDTGASERILNNLVNNWNSICSCLESLNKNDLRDSPGKVYDVAKEVFPYILNIEGINQHYSFTTKFFYWCTRKHFPIMDNRARSAINEIQRNHGITRGLVLKDTAEMGELSYLDEYERWVYFYSDLLRSLDEATCNKLIIKDEQTQRRTSEQFIVKNSLLRILDKVFYMLGRQ